MEKNKEPNFYEYNDVGDCVASYHFNANALRIIKDLQSRLARGEKAIQAMEKIIEIKKLPAFKEYLINEILKDYEV